MFAALSRYAQDRNVALFALGLLYLLMALTNYRVREALIGVALGVMWSAVETAFSRPQEIP